MALSYTYIQAQQQIAEELGERTNLLAGSGIWAPIKNAIQSAVAKWEQEPFWFNELYDSPITLFTTVAGQARYTVSDAAELGTVPYITDLRIVMGDNRYVLKRVSWTYLEEIDTSVSATGQPTEWAYYAEQIRLYPAPSGAWPVRGSRLKIHTALSADADTNVWLSDAYDLIRCEAKLHLARNVLRDPQLAAECEAQIYGSRGYLYVLKAASTRRAKSRIRPSQF